MCLQTIQEWHLFLLIGCLLLIDITFLLPVTAVPSAILKSMPVQLPYSVSECICNKTTRHLPKVSVAEHYTINLSLHPILFFQGELLQEVTLCSSDTSHIWIPILLVYKAVELVFSLIFAFETRKVKVKELNDSKIIVFCVYTIVVSAIALGPTNLLLQDKPTTHYAVIGVVCLLTATVLLAIIYVPKVTSLSDVIQSMNMHVLYDTLPLKPNKLVYPLSSLPVACSGTHLQCPLLKKHNILLLVIIMLIPCTAYRCTHCTRIPVEMLTWTSPISQTI